MTTKIELGKITHRETAMDLKELIADIKGYLAAGGIEPESANQAVVEDRLQRSLAAIAALDAEAAPFRPMSIEDAVEAYGKANAEVLTEADIDKSGRYATDAGYRSEVLYERYIQQHAIARGLKAEVERLRKLAEKAGLKQ